MASEGTIVIVCDCSKTQIESYITDFPATTILSITGSERLARFQHESLPDNIRGSFHYDDESDKLDTLPPDPLTCFKRFIVPYSRVFYHNDVDPYDLVILEYVNTIMPFVDDQESLNNAIRAMAIRQIMNQARTLLITTPKISIGLHDLLKESNRTITKITDLTVQIAKEPQ